jgi:hypothetical protein
VLALVPAAVFAALWRGSGRRLAGWTALAWLLYAAYEYGMRRRWLCSGECNIRVDLLLIYPVLLMLSIAALVAVMRGRRRPGDDAPS